MFKLLKKLILIDLVLSIFTVPLFFFAHGSAFAQTATFIPATSTSEARIEFTMGQENVDKADVAAWVAQQTASAPKQVSAPVVVKGLSERVISASYFVQAASYTDRPSANSALNGFAGGKIEPALVNGTQYYRVLVGPFENKADAKKARTSVLIAGFDGAFVRG